MTFFSYCEFNLALFFYSPITFATIYYLSKAQEADMIEIYNQISPDLKFRVTNPTQQNIARTLNVVITLLIAKYM